MENEVSHSCPDFRLFVAVKRLCKNPIPSKVTNFKVSRFNKLEKVLEVLIFFLTNTTSLFSLLAIIAAYAS